MKKAEVWQDILEKLWSAIKQTSFFEYLLKYTRTLVREKGRGFYVIQRKIRTGKIIFSKIKKKIHTQIYVTDGSLLPLKTAKVSSTNGQKPQAIGLLSLGYLCNKHIAQGVLKRSNQIFVNFWMYFGLKHCPTCHWSSKTDQHSIRSCCYCMCILNLSGSCNLL